MTSKEAKLIVLGMNILKRERQLEKEWISEFLEALYEKERVKAETEYFDLRFEMNREKLEEKYIVERTEQDIEQSQIEQEMSVGSNFFIEYCWEICFKNL